EKRTGVNRVYLASIQLKFALYFNDTALINSAKELINNEIYITNDVDGLQPDYTYHFHNARIQEYAYGKGFLESCVDVFELLNHTPYHFSENKIAILRNFILDSWQWLARGSYTVPSTMDRSSSSKGALKAPQIIETLERFKKIDTLHALDYQKIIEQQNNIKNFNLIGVKNFPYSDIAVAHSSNASIFIKVLSDRNLPTESINSENLQGKFLHFGNHFIIKDAIEYTNILGAFDWNLLPGFSYIEGTESIKRFSNTGVAKFDDVLVVNMSFDYLDDKQKSITPLNKTWIVQQDKLICLIAAPKNTLNKPIKTSLNQVRFRNGVFINNQKMALQKSTVTLKNGDYLYHDNLIYFSPDAIQYIIENRANDWGTISKSYKKEKKIDSLAIFTATITQKNQATSYAIVYAQTAIENPYKSNLYSTVYNNNDIQMIYLNNEDAYCGTIFNPNQEFKIPSLKKVIKVTKPILF
ncbi:MAG TPA: polysaccharide lyase family 8 super-sandwich domain-containing protein, partial [Chitinophagaceae bacterium]|nr:polysaccharide lyase family 8 super-sandwich domain-containing protein [Chitinophagaceae bacterium]